MVVEKYGDPKFQVRDVACDLPFVTVEAAALRYEQNVAGYELKFTLKADQRPPAAFQGTVTFETNDAEFPRFTLPVMGSGGPGQQPPPVDER